WVAPSNSLTVLPASAVPVKVGVATLVMLSVFDAPLSEAAPRSGVEGAAGEIGRASCRGGAEAEVGVAAVSGALAVRLCNPTLRRVLLVVHVWLVSSAVVLRSWVAPSNSLTVLPASAVPVKVGVAALVMLSVSDAPLSEAAPRSGVEGAAG